MVGEKLKTVLKKDCEQEKLGESWEISDIDKNETLTREGYLKGYSLIMLIKEFKGDFLGNVVYEKFGDNFLILIKFIKKSHFIISKIVSKIIIKGYRSYLLKIILHLLCKIIISIIL